MVNFKLEHNNKILSYIDLLLEWQKKLNLISNNSKPILWDRHIKDSLQLNTFITTKNKTIVDLGTGAGFPGLILSIYDTNNQYILVDSNIKKTTFLNVVKTKLNLNNVTIVNDRIENLYNRLSADIIVARAITNLEKLLEYSKNILKPCGKAIFLKGKNLQNEIENIKQQQLLNLFTFEIFNNKVNNNGKIIIFKYKNICKYE